MAYKYTDTRKKTIRTNTKSTLGGLLSGVEAHHQGLEILNSNQDRSALPILGRSGLGSSGYQYDETRSVFQRAQTPSVLLNNQSVTVDIDIQSCRQNLSANLLNGDPHFKDLIGSRFEIKNPRTGDSYEFEFTSDVVFDPRDVFFCNYYNPAIDPTDTAGGVWSLFYLFHALPHERIPGPKTILKHPLWAERNRHRRQVWLRLYDSLTSPLKILNNNNRYEIPIGVPINQFVDGVDFQSFEGISRRGLVPWTSWNSLGSLEYFARSWLDYTNPGSANLLVRGWYIEFLTALVMHEVFLDDPDLRVDFGRMEDGDTKAYWLTNAKINIISDTAERGSFTNTTGVNVNVTQWTQVQDEKIYLGERVIRKDPRKFHEDEFSDTLKSVSGHGNFSTGYPAGDPYLIPLRSNRVPKSSMGVVYPTVEEYVDNKAVSVDETFEVPIFKMVPTQKRETLFNTYEDDFLFHEDVHYQDPNEQTWSKLQNTWRIYTTGATDQEGFVNYITDMLDKRFTRAELIPESPMSGIVNVFETAQGFYENMPHHVLENSRGSVLTQWLDDTQVVASFGDKWWRHQNDRPIKRYEDLVGARSTELQSQDFVDSNNPSLGVKENNSIMFNDFFDQEPTNLPIYIEEDRWTRIDDDFLVHLTSHPNRETRIDRREWQEDDYLYGGTGSVSSTQSSRSSIINRDQKR